jgi:hypothetical protein
MVRRRCLCTSPIQTCCGRTSFLRHAWGRAPLPPASSCCTERRGSCIENCKTKCWMDMFLRVAVW